MLYSGLWGRSYPHLQLVSSFTLTISKERLLQRTGEVWSKEVKRPCELDVQILIASNFVAASIQETWWYDKLQQKWKSSPSAERAPVPVIAAIFLKTSAPPRMEYYHRRTIGCLKLPLKLLSASAKNGIFIGGTTSPKILAHRIFPENEEITTHHHPIMR